MLPCGPVADGALVVTNGDRTEHQGHSRGWVVIPQVCPSPSGPQRPGWHPVTVEVLWMCRCCHWWLCTRHWVAQLDLGWTLGSTSGSALSTGQHSWLCTRHQEAQLVLYWMLGSTAGLAPHVGRHSWFYTECCVAQLAPHLPLPDLSRGTRCPGLHPGLLSVATAAAGTCWGMAAGHQWIFSADSLVLLLKASACICSFKEYFTWVKIASSYGFNKKSVGLLVFKSKSDIQLFCQEHILPAVMCHLVRPKEVPWQTPGALLGTVSKAFAHACSLYSCWIT